MSPRKLFGCERMSRQRHPREFAVVSRCEYLDRAGGAGRPTEGGGKMRAAFHVQQRDGRDWRWRTVTTTVTSAAANARADELRQALDDLPYRPTAPVRVVSTAELSEEARISRAAGEMVRRSASPAAKAS